MHSQSPAKLAKATAQTVFSEKTGKITSVIVEKWWLKIKKKTDAAAVVDTSHKGAIKMFALLAAANQASCSPCL